MNTGLPLGDALTGFAALGTLIAAYMAPTIIAYSRKVKNVGSIAVINVMLGWTFIGWVIALAWSLKSVEEDNLRKAGNP
jgi:hypothetical protein